MHADDAALENFETSDRIDAGTGPVPDIGTYAESRVTILDEREDIVGIPEFVAGFVRALRMTVNARADIVFPDEFLDQVDLVGRWFDGDGAHTEFFREFKDLTCAGFVLRDSHHAEVHDE